MSTPIPVLLVVASTMVFIAMFMGDPIPTLAQPDIAPPDEVLGDEEADSFWGVWWSRIKEALGVEAVADAISTVGLILATIWDVVTYVLNIITFNLEPQPPAWVRAIVATAITGGTIWYVALMVRGGGGSG